MYRSTFFYFIFSGMDYHVPNGDQVGLGVFTIFIFVFSFFILIWWLMYHCCIYEMDTYPRYEKLHNPYLHLDTHRRLENQSLTVRPVSSSNSSRHGPSDNAPPSYKEATASW
jgi:hypothetical protein